MVGIHSPSFRRAAILYTPVRAGSLPPVTRLVPTPHTSMGAPRVTSCWMMCLVQLVGGDDLRIGEPRRIQPLAHLLAEVLQVAAVEAHPEVLLLRCGETPADGDGILDPAAEGVVGVDEQDAVVGVGLGVLLEGFPLAREGHDPRVGHGPAHGDAEALPCQGVGGGSGPPDEGRAGGRQGAVHPLRPAQAELEKRAAVGRQPDAGSLGRDQGLEIDDGEQGALDELCLDQGRMHAHQRLAGEGEGSLVHRPDVSREAEARQLVEELPAERPEAVQVGDVVGGEPHPRDVGQPRPRSRRRRRTRRRRAGGGRTCRRRRAGSFRAGSTPASSTARRNPSGV